MIDSTSFNYGYPDPSFDLAEFDRQQLAVANRKWFRSLHRRPQPLGSKFCDRLAVTITDEPAEWGKLFSFAISQSTGVNHAS